MKGRKPKEKAAQPVSFRLDPDYLQWLEDEAKHHKMSAGEYARKLVMEARDDTRNKQLEAELVSFQGQIFELRRDLATAVQALLIGAGKTSPEKSRQWVLENLRVGQ